MKRRQFFDCCITTSLGAIGLGLFPFESWGISALSSKIIEASTAKKEQAKKSEKSPSASPDSDYHAESSFTFESNKTAVILKEGKESVWQYNFGFLTHDHVPISDPRRQAGSYFHPVYGVHGEILTDNAPKDHFHHHGIFWTWPHVLLHEKNGSTREFDLWTSNTPIRQYFIRELEHNVKNDKAILTMENGWFIDKVIVNDEGKVISGEKVMKEIVRVTTHPRKITEGLTGRFLDFDFTWTPVGRDISLRGAENKSYGGFTVRFRPPTATSSQTRITTPEGIAPNDLPEKPLTWADYTSVFSKKSTQKSGGTVFIPKSHPDYPPTWLARYYGPLCVGWPGVIAQKFKEGETIKLQYRLWIHDGQPSREQIEKIYQQYLHENN